VILVDTSVWIDHFRRRNDRLAELLESGVVLCHPFVVGELACGSIGDRVETLHLLRMLPTATVVTHDEALAFVEVRELMGRGLGYIDVHLLASAFLAGALLWTLDKRLSGPAQALGVSA
jgi:hypothetical protein